MRINILFGGRAGQGPNILTDLVANGLISKGYYVFYSRDYQSLIRGGHNFNILTFSDKPAYSNDSKIDIIAALDENTLKLHKGELKRGAIILDEKYPNMYFAGALFKTLDIEFSFLEKELRALGKKLNENLRDARAGFNREKRKIALPKPCPHEKKPEFMNGNQAIAQAAIASGIDFYFAYPMTPATGVLTELAQLELNKNNKHLAIQLSDEIAVINSAIGSGLMGALSMAGTSGGGFDLMTEALSLAGMAEIPVVIYLSQRPGPSTGVPTYTGQGDLNAALYSGHGEFNRIVTAPGDIIESQEITSQLFYFSQKYRIPAILLGDKHLAESKFTAENPPALTQIQKSITCLEKFSSYEHTPDGISTEEPAQMIKAAKARLKKRREIADEAKKFQTYKEYGNTKSKNLVVSWGSTKGAIIDAIKQENLNCKFIQVLYLEPFPEKLADELKRAEKILVVENNATSGLSSLIAQKTGIFIDDKNKILKYDGRPFFADELAGELKKKGVR